MLDSRLKELEYDEKKRHNLRSEDQADKDRYAKMYGDTVRAAGSFGKALLGGTNDFAFYARSNKERLIRNATTGFDWPVGQDFPWDASSVVDNTSKIAIVKFIPTLGSTLDDTVRNFSGVQAYELAIDKLYMLMRGDNTGYSSNYDAADIGLYFVPVDSLAILYHRLRRAVGLSRRYNVLNQAEEGRALVAALGFDYDDMVVDYKSYNDVLAQMEEALAVLPVFDAPWFSRHVWLIGNVFLDSDAERARLFAYDVKAIFRVSTNNPGVVEAIEVSTYSTASSYWQLFADCYRRLRDVTSLKVIIADMQKVPTSDKGKELGVKCITLGVHLGDKEIVEPYYDDNACLQFQNLHLNDVFLNIKQQYGGSAQSHVLGFRSVGTASGGYEMKFGYQPVSSSTPTTDAEICHSGIAGRDFIPVTYALHSIDTSVPLKYTTNTHVMFNGGLTNMSHVWKSLKGILSYINTYFIYTSPEDVVELSRGMITTSKTGVAPQTLTTEMTIEYDSYNIFKSNTAAVAMMLPVVDFGSELFCYIDLYNLDARNNPVKQVRIQTFNVSDDTWGEAACLYEMVDSFDHFPAILISVDTPNIILDNGGQGMVQNFSDAFMRNLKAYNYTSIQARVLAKLHVYCLLSELDVSTSGIKEIATIANDPGSKPGSSRPDKRRHHGKKPGNKPDNKKDDKDSGKPGSK